MICCHNCDSNINCDNMALSIIFGMILFINLRTWGWVIIWILL